MRNKVIKALCICISLIPILFLLDISNLKSLSVFSIINHVLPFAILMIYFYFVSKCDGSKHKTEILDAVYSVESISSRKRIIKEKQKMTIIWLTINILIAPIILFSFIDSVFNKNFSVSILLSFTPFLYLFANENPDVVKLKKKLAIINLIIIIIVMGYLARLVF